MGFVGKILIIMLAVDIMLFVGGASGAGDLLVFGDFLDVSLTTNETTNTTIGTVNATDNLTSNLVPSGDSIISSLIQSVVLPVFLVINFINLAVSVLLAPVTFVNAIIGIPGEIQLLVSGTVIVLYAIGIISAIRGYDL